MEKLPAAPRSEKAQKKRDARIEARKADRLKARSERQASKAATTKES